MGLPLGTTKPKIIDLMPLVDKTERRLTSISSMLNQASRLQLVNSVLSSLPTYTMCSIKSLRESKIRLIEPRNTVFGESQK